MASNKIPRICEQCGEPFEARKCVVRAGRGRFCSPKCQRAWQLVPIAERLRRGIGQTTPTGCMPWTGSHSKRGYGRIQAGGKRSKMLLTHRVAYEIVNGPIPDGLKALHRCDNPPCCNPAHIFLGTQQDNMDDQVAKQRQVKGERHHNAKLTDSIVREARIRQEQDDMATLALAAEYGVSSSAMDKALRRVSWRHVS